MWFRLLLEVLAVFLAIKLWRAFCCTRECDVDKTGDERPVEDMVCCAHCGLYLPEQESIRAHGGFYCCEAHRMAGGRKKAP